MKEIELKNGRLIQMEMLHYPLTPERRAQVIDLLQKEWERTDVDWLQSMRGKYDEVLVIKTLLARCDGIPVATAGAAFPRNNPEVFIIEDVMTLPEFRGLGIARILTCELVDFCFGQGCSVAYLGNAPTPRPVYEKAGFSRLSGVLMRRAAPGRENYEKEIFGTGENLEVRPADWGDLPGFACFMAQPIGIRLAHYNQMNDRNSYSRGQGRIGARIRNFAA